MIYEGTGPGGTLYLIEGMTDNRNRTVAELRKIFEKHNGQLSAAGAAMWAFDRKGVILLAKEAATEDQLMEVAVGAGADDYTDQGEEWQILAPVAALETVVKTLEAAKVTAWIELEALAAGVESRLENFTELVETAIAN